MPGQTTHLAKWDWAEQLIHPLENIVERVGEYNPDNDTADFEEMLLEPLSISGGESFSAENHSGREILELLQNAQDAAGGLYTKDSSPTIGERSIYIGISEDGLLVANTGDAFNFSDPKIRKSLRILGHSETGEETIGQFGVGLTSIRGTGDAYEVWTKDPDHDELLEWSDCWRVFCGPRTTVAAIASADTDSLGSERGLKAYNRFRDQVVGRADVLDFSSETSPLRSVPLSDDQIPYFTYPVAMQSWYEPPTGGSVSGNQLRSRAHELLTYGHDVGSQLDSVPDHIRSLLSDVGAFTTAVFVDYEDEDWQAIFEAITGNHPGIADDGELASKFEDQAWFDGSDAARVTPELLLNLGHIDRLVVERLSDSETESKGSFQDWKVFGRDRIKTQEASTLPVSGRHIVHNAGEREVDAVEVAVQLKTSINHDHLQAPSDTSSEMYSFWDAEFTDNQQYGEYKWFDSSEDVTSGDDDDTGDLADQDIDVSILLQTTEDRDELYRPHLYYPIDGVDKEFPYCIHGDFVVQQDRQSLAGSGLARNCVVAEEAATLVGCLSEALAISDVLSNAEREAIPWRLLPAKLSKTRGKVDWPNPEDLVERSSGEVADNDPIKALKASIYRHLRIRSNVQVVSDGGTQRSIASGEGSDLDVILHHDPTVLVGIGALYSISKCASEELNIGCVFARVDSMIELSIPTQSTLDYLLRWLTPEMSDFTPTELKATHGLSETEGDHLTNELLDNVPADEPTDRGLRIKHLITGGKDVTEFSPLPATLWWTILQEWGLAIDRTVDVGQAITGVPSETGHALLNATMKLGSDEEAFPDSDQFDPTPNLYLLPCRQLMSETDGSHSSADIDKNHVQLVNVESHESRENNHRQVLRPENTAITEIAPPAETGFALYSLSKEAFENHGGSITEAPWGTRNYGGSADLYRTLLKDIADRSTEVMLADIQFLETVYERINFEEATIDLYPLEGSYHARDQVKKLATSRNSVDKLKTRNDVRRVTAPSKLVEGTEETLAQDIRFDDHLLRYWNSTNVAVEHENEESAETSTESATDQPLPPIETNGPQTHLPADIKGQLDENIETESNLVTQLGMLGVSVLPGVRTLLIRGDEAHPDRHENLSWDPTEWNTTNSDRVKNLQTLLDTQNGEMYLDLLTTPPFGPGESSYHTKHCDVKQYPRKESSLRDELSNYEVMLTSWVWLSPTTCEEIIASDLADLLSEYGDKFAESIFATGWSCNHGGGNTRHVNEFVPTLLNWQLRTVTGWEAKDWFNPPSIDGLWADHDTWSLLYAVLEAEGGRQTASSALPQIDPSKSPISKEVWKELGIKTLDDLNAIESAYRLNALLEAAMEDTSSQDTAFGAEGKPSNALPGIENIDAWKTLYGKLLDKIATEVSERGDHMTLEKLQFLDWVPAKDHAGNWVALPIDNLDSAVYYDSIESNWENRIARLQRGQYLLKRPESGFVKADHFESLWTSTDATQESAQYPEIEKELTTSEGVEPLRKTLADSNVMYGVLAAASGQKKLARNRENYDSFIDTLRLVEPHHSELNCSETSWQVTPLSNEVGLTLDNVERDSTDSYAVACDGVDPNEPVELADFFIALFNGGNKDSYKLALLGHDVEGKDDIREKLRETDVQQLEADLRLSERLLDSTNSLERGTLTLGDDTSVRGLRESISECLHEGKTLPSDVQSSLPDDALETIGSLCTNDDGTLRKWAGDIIDPTTSNSTDELRSKLTLDLPEETPSESQLNALERLESELSDTRSDEHLPRFDDLLPNPLTVEVTDWLHNLVAGVLRLDDRAKSDVTSIEDLLDHDCQITWSDHVLFSEKDRSSVETATVTTDVSDVFPEPCTWFHLAWWLDNDNKDPGKSEPAQAILNTVSALLGGENEVQLKRIRTEAQKGVSRSSNSSTDNTFNSSSKAKLLGQIDTDVEWSTSSSSLDSSLTATLRSPGGGNAKPFIQQTTVHPDVAELSVLRGAYTALCESGVTFSDINSKLTDLDEEDDNFWRTPDGWNEYKQFITHFESDELPAPDDLAKRETEYPTVAFDITDEGTAGYDILDPTGWSVRCARDSLASREGIDLEPYKDRSTLTPVPVEVKSVNASNPSFKFSLNQYRRAYDFVSNENNDSVVPYVIFLVEVKDCLTEEDENKYTVNSVKIIVITCPDDLRQLLPDGLSPSENDQVIDDLILRVLRGGDLIIG